MELQKIDNATLREKVYSILREKITTAKIKPGERMTLRGLTEQLHVSIAPVREALFQLESEKVVEIFSNKHIQVRKLSKTEIEEIYRIRIMLESAVVERACDLMTPENLALIEKKLGNLHMVAASAHEYIEHNRDFHFAIYQQAGSPISLELITNLWARVGSYVYLHFSTRKDISLNMEHHVEMYQSLLARDKKALARALRQDLEIAAKDITTSLTD